MKTKQMAFGLIMLAALALSIPIAAVAEDTQYEPENLIIQLGSNETQMNFSWFTTDTSGSCQLVVAPKHQYKKHPSHRGHCPERADYYFSESELVEVEDSGSGGFGPPPSAKSVSNDEEEVDTYACTISVEKLRQNTEYSYKVGNGDTFSESYSFDTKNTNRYNFIFVGDPQIGASRDVDSDAAGWTETVTAALTKFKRTSFILSAGDQVESSTSDAQYDAFLGAEELTSVPFAPTIGNHDKSELYAYHFNVPNESTEYGVTENVGGDYWFTYGKTLFMVLNSNNSSALAHSEFMTQAIEANPQAKWRVVVFHHSIYSSARHVDDVNDLRTAMFPVIDDHDIDVVLAGHDHFYARSHQLSEGDVVGQVCYTSTSIDRRTGEEVTKTTCLDVAGEAVDEEDIQYIGEDKVLNPEGTVYFTANSASGSKYYDFTNIEGYTNYYLAAYEQLETPSYLNVEVSDSALTVSAYRTDTGDRVDTYTIVKVKPKKHKGWHNKFAHMHH